MKSVTKLQYFWEILLVFVILMLFEVIFVAFCHKNLC